MTVFRVWAPAAGKAEVQVQGDRHPMHPAAAPGWWEADVSHAAGAADYAFRLDDGEPLPDPRSPRQPLGSQGVSRCYDHSAFGWSDPGWRGAPLPGSVIYELHIGTFTAEGTFDAAIGQLDHLAVPLVVLGQIYQCHGSPAEAMRSYEEALALAEAMHERARDYEAVTAIVAVTAEHRHLAFEQLAVHRFHRGHDLPAGVFHQHERRDTDLVDRPPIGFTHLCGVQDAHRSITKDTKDTSLRHRWPVTVGSGFSRIEDWD